MKKIPKKFTPIVFAFLMAGMMAFVMSGFMIYINVGYSNQFFAIWMRGFVLAILVAVPTSFCARFIAQKIVDRIIE